MYFEYCKHFTTLTTAAALVEIAIYQHFDIYSVVAILGIGVLGVALMLSVAGMLFLPIRAAERNRFAQKDTLSPMAALMILIGTLFVLGIVAFAMAAAELSPLVALMPAIILGAGMGIFIVLTLESEKRSGSESATGHVSSTDSDQTQGEQPTAEKPG